MTPDRILIVDGLNAFIRNWCVNPTLNINGEHIGGTIGMIRSVKNLIKEVKPTKLVVCWDGSGGSVRRRGVQTEYKAGRKPRTNRQYDFETIEQSQANMHWQREKTEQYLSMLGAIQITIDDIEADDTIGFLCSAMFRDVDKVVVSTDKDFLQLVDSHTLVYSPTKKLYYTVASFKEEIGVLPENFVFARSLTGEGDKSDNIKGIKGIGMKTIAKLFPFLCEHESSVEEIIDYCSAHLNESPKYGTIMGSRDLLIENVNLMQLRSPIISLQSVRAIRYAFENISGTGITMSEFKLAMIKDGLQLTDTDFFSVFREFQARAQQKEAIV